MTPNPRSRAPRRVPRAGAALAAEFLVVAIGVACSSPSAPLSAYPVSAEPGEPVPRAGFDDRDASMALEAMRSVHDGQPIEAAPTRSTSGRWSDVPAALGEACGREGIEAAIVRTTAEDEGRTLRFAVLTAEEWRGEVVVRRGDPVDWNAVRAESWLGSVPGRAHTERLEALIDAFEESLLLYGRKRAWE